MLSKQMKENHITICKTARYYTQGVLNEKTKQVWGVLHGFGQSAKAFLSGFEPLFDDASFFIAPEALNRFYMNGHNGAVGVTWMTKEERLNEIKDYVCYLDQLYEHLELNKFHGIITALGFSQGASTLSRWINAANSRVETAIIYGGEVGPELLPLNEKSGLKKTKNIFIYGTSDKYFPPDVVSKMRVAYKELNCTEIQFEGGHEIKTEILQRFKL